MTTALEPFTSETSTDDDNLVHLACCETGPHTTGIVKVLCGKEGVGGYHHGQITRPCQVCALIHQDGDPCPDHGVCRHPEPPRWNR